MKRSSLVTAALLAVSLLASFVPTANAQGQPWDTNVLTWVPAATCTTGEPASACPTTGYRLETAAIPTGAYTLVTTTAAAALSFTHNGVSAGQHCYRLFALSANGDSLPSNISCRTNVKPVGPPNPPVLTIAALAGLGIPLDSGDGFTRTPVFTITAGGPGVLVGFCKVGTPSVEDAVYTYRSQPYCKPLLNHPRTGVANIAWLKGVTPSANVAAPCA